MYRSYRDAVDPALRAVDRRLTTERPRRGSGIDRARDSKTWRAALESLPNGTVIIGAHGQLDSCSPTACSRFRSAAGRDPRRGA